MNSRIYVLSGFGFSADIFSFGALANVPYTKLEYADLNNRSINAMVMQLAQIITAEAIIIAWSFGGLLAIKIAHLFPDKVKKLILLASQPRLVTKDDGNGFSVDTLNVLNTMMQNDFNPFKKHFINLVNFPNRHKDYKRQLENCFIAHPHSTGFFKLMQTVDLRAEYQMLKMKILHIIGSKDAVLPQNNAYLLALNERIHIVNIENAGHAGFLTHAELYHLSIMAFIYD